MSKGWFVRAASAMLAILVLCYTFPQLTRATPASTVRDEARKFIEQYTNEYQNLYYAYELADWASNTHIVEGDESNSEATNAALERLSTFTGSKANLDTAQSLLKNRKALTSLQVKQLERIVYI